MAWLVLACSSRSSDSIAEQRAERPATSAAQPAEELNHAGRKVYLSVGHFHRTPRRYRDRDGYWWFDVLRLWHRSLELHPEIRNARFVVTGVRGGHEIDLRRLAAEGMTLLGRLRGLADSKLILADDLEESLAQGDAWFDSLKLRMDEYAEKDGMPPAEERPSDELASALPPWSRPMTELDLRGAGVTSVVWCSGFRYDFTWVKLPVLNEAGEPLHRRGVTQRPGLYFLGAQAHTLLELGAPGGGRYRCRLSRRTHRRTVVTGIACAQTRRPDRNASNRYPSLSTPDLDNTIIEFSRAAVDRAGGGHLPNANRRRPP